MNDDPLRRTMHLNNTRPACYCEDPDPSPRSPGFWDDGRSCGTALTPELWLVSLAHTPACYGCTRSLRALYLHARADPETIPTLISSFVSIIKPHIKGGSS
jgi:hypothetical protein